MSDGLLFAGIGLFSSLFTILVSHFLSGNNKKIDAIIKTVDEIKNKFHGLDKQISIAEIAVEGIKQSSNAISNLSADQAKQLKDLNEAYVKLREQEAWIMKLRSRSHYAMNEFCRLSYFLPAYQPQPVEKMSDII